MNTDTAVLATAAATMRAEFDRAFARAPAPPGEGSLALLAIRAGGTPFAVRLADVRGLHADRKVLALPTPVPALLGVTGLRGQIVPVYDLSALLGQERASSPRWLLLVAARQPLALAFDGFDGHVAATAAQLIEAGPNGNGALRLEGQMRPILDLTSLTAAIEQGARNYEQKLDLRP